MKAGSKMRIKGLRVVDTKGKRRLIISHSDIRGASIKDPENCAAAVALRREPGVQEARVYLSRTYLKEGDKYIRYLTPRSLRDEVVAFDRGGKFEPGAHVLLPVQASAHIGTTRPKHKPPKKSHPQKGARSTVHRIHGVRPDAHKGLKYR